MPVEVSECTTVTASYRAFPSARRTSSGSTGLPHGASRTSTAIPRSRAQPAQRSEKAPEAIARTRSGMRFSSAASQSPVAAEVVVKTNPSVRNTFWSRGGIRA